MSRELKVNPQPRQYEALKLLLDDFGGETEEVLYGGAGGGGKTFLGLLWILPLCLRFPGIRFFIARKELKDLHAATWPSVAEACTVLDIPLEWVEYRRQESTVLIRNGGKGEPSIISLISANWEPSDPHYDRYGSYQWTSGWVEEAQQVPERAIEVLKTRIGRWKNDEWGIRPRILLTANPSKGYLYRLFYKPWREGTLPKHMAFIQAFHTDNKYLSVFYRQQLNNIRDEATRQRIKDGIWEFGEDGSLIPFDALQDLFTNIVDTDGARALTADVARYGSDRCAIWLWEGRKATLVRTYVKKSIPATAAIIRTLAEKYQVPRSRIGIDEDGVGGGVVDLLPGCFGFMANSSPDPSLYMPKNENEQYQNLKAQCGYKLAEEVNERRLRVAIAHDCCEEGDPDKDKIKDMVVADLEQLKKWKSDEEKKLRLMPKEEIKKALGRSPDFMDGLVIRMGISAALSTPKEQREEYVDNQEAFDQFAVI